MMLRCQTCGNRGYIEVEDKDSTEAVKTVCPECLDHGCYRIEGDSIYYVASSRPLTAISPLIGMAAMAAPYMLTPKPRREIKLNKKPKKARTAEEIAERKARKRSKKKRRRKHGR